MVHDVDVDRVLDALGHRARRQLLAALRAQFSDGNPETDVATLCEALATDGDERRVRLRLVHCDLPMLDDLGYADWDRETGTVARGRRWDELRAVRDLLGDEWAERRDA